MFSFVEISGKEYLDFIETKGSGLAKALLSLEGAMDEIAKSPSSVEAIWNNSNASVQEECRRLHKTIQDLAKLADFARGHLNNTFSVSYDQAVFLEMI